MEIKQFAEFVSAVVRQLPRDLDPTRAQKWIVDQGGLAQALCKALGLTFELYLAPAQQNGGSIKGFDLEEHLKKMKLIDRTMSLEDEVVKGWLVDPTSYPKEFKGKAVFLWKSQRTSGRNRDVAYLIWLDDRVVVNWDWQGNGWFGVSPVLLASS